MPTPSTPSRRRHLGLLLAVAVSACDSDDPVTDEERLLAIAEHDGLDVSDAEYDGEYLYIGDMAYGPHHLPEYDAIASDSSDRAFLFNENSRVIDLGFRDICFEIDDSGDDSAEDWIATFNTITSDLNGLGTTIDAVNRRKSVGCPGGREVIAVSTANYSGDILGKADIPSENIINGNTHPGNWIKLDRGRAPSLRVASHETLHALGFAHVDDTGNDWVSGTCASVAACTGVTIMFSTGPADQVGFLSDDEDALQTVY